MLGIGIFCRKGVRMSRETEAVKMMNRTYCYFQQLSPHFSCCGEKVDGGDVVILHYCCLVFAWCPTMANWTCAELQLHIHCIGVP